MKPTILALLLLLTPAAAHAAGWYFVTIGEQNFTVSTFGGYADEASCEAWNGAAPITSCWQGPAAGGDEFAFAAVGYMSLFKTQIRTFGSLADCQRVAAAVAGPHGLNYAGVQLPAWSAIQTSGCWRLVP